MWKSKVKEVSVLLCLLCSTFFSPVTASRLVNSERTLTLWQALFRHLAFVCVEAPSHIQTAWWLPPGGQAVYGPVSTACAVITGPPPQGSGSLWPCRCYAVLESVSLQDWCLFYTALETLTSCCHDRDPHSFVWTPNCDFSGQKGF